MRSSGSLVACVWVVVGVGATLPAPAAAYCVYNYSDRPFEVEQVDGQSSATVRFRREVGPGRSACCPWDHALCNGAQTAEAPVTLRVSRGGAVVCEVTIAADAWMEVEADGDASNGGALACRGF